MANDKFEGVGFSQPPKRLCRQPDVGCIAKMPCVVAVVQTWSLT